MVFHINETRLFDYQKTCVRWLWGLYSNDTGGIVGDEMGLGKTIQMIAFISGLHYSKKLKKPVIVIAPATVLRQWCNEFHKWWPPLRVSILHSSGSGMHEGRKGDIESDDEDDPHFIRGKSWKTESTAKRIVQKVIDRGMLHCAFH